MFSVWLSGLDYRPYLVLIYTFSPFNYSNMLIYCQKSITLHHNMAATCGGKNAQIVFAKYRIVTFIYM